MRLKQWTGAAAISLMLLTQPSAGIPQSRGSRSSIDGYSLTFVDADARAVVDAVLGSMMGANYSIDPAVQGTITLRTAQPVRRDELVPLLESALAAINAVIIVDQNRYRVVPRAAAQAQAPMAGAFGADNAGPGFATEVITLTSASPQQVAAMLRQLVGENVVASIEPGFNRLVIVGTAEERRAAHQLIERMDVDTASSMQFELVRLETVDAQTLANELRSIFVPPFDVLGSRVRVVPLPRLRSVLLIAADRGDIARIQSWIARLDSGAAGRRRLYSYSVQNGRARDLAAILQRILSSSNGVDEPAQTDLSASTDDSQASTTANPGTRATATTASADPAADVGQRRGREAQQAPRVVASDQTNALLIYANGEEYEFIRDAITRLDQPVPQVLIEAILAEVTLTQDFQFGVDLRAISGDVTAVNSSTGSATPASIFPGFSATWIGSSASAILNTLQSRTNVRVLSAPRLMVLNNQAATLQVGDQVPIVTQQVQGVVSPGSPIVNNIELRDTGVILRVTPRVNESGTVTLDIAQEVSDVARTTTSGINSPTIQQRRLSSVVATRSGQMVALGGLIRDRAETGRSGIPLLSQIPILGGLFGRQTRGGSRTELIVFLTPTVVRSPDDVPPMVDSIIERLQRAAPLVQQGRDRQVGGHNPTSDPAPVPTVSPRE